MAQMSEIVKDCLINSPGTIIRFHKENVKQLHILCQLMWESYHASMCCQRRKGVITCWFKRLVLLWVSLADHDNLIRIAMFDVTKVLEYLKVLQKQMLWMGLTSSRDMKPEDYNALLANLKLVYRNNSVIMQNSQRLFEQLNEVRSQITADFPGPCMACRIGELECILGTNEFGKRLTDLTGVEPEPLSKRRKQDGDASKQVETPSN